MCENMASVLYTRLAHSKPYKPCCTDPTFRFGSVHATLPWQEDTAQLECMHAGTTADRTQSSLKQPVQLIDDRQMGVCCCKNPPAGSMSLPSKKQYCFYPARNPAPSSSSQEVIDVTKQILREHSQLRTSKVQQIPQIRKRRRCEGSHGRSSRNRSCSREGLLSLHLNTQFNVRSGHYAHLTINVVIWEP